VIINPTVLFSALVTAGFNIGGCTEEGVVYALDGKTQIQNQPDINSIIQNIRSNGMTNKSTKAVDAVKAASVSITNIMVELNKLAEIQQILGGSEINLMDFDTDIQADANVNYCDTNTYQYILSDVVPNSIVAGLKAYYSGIPTQQAFAAMNKATKL
jgi:hypothetical protein